MAVEADTISRRELALFVALGVAIRVAWMILFHAFIDPVDLRETNNATFAFARQGSSATPISSARVRPRT